VTSNFPSSITGAETQRKRWEGGHIDTILRASPGLLARALARGDWKLLALSFDLAVPPLSLLCMLALGILAVSGLASFFGLSSAAFVISAASLLAFAMAVFLAWLKCGRDLLPASALLLIPNYVVVKFALYRELLISGTNSRWVRTDRRKF